MPPERPSLRLRLLNAALRRLEKPWLAKVRDPLDARSGFERSARRVFRDPPHALYQRVRLPEGAMPLRATWASAGPASSRSAILYLHGGAYVMGSARTHRAMLAALSARCAIAACLPDYRLAPEHPFPAALEDTLTAYRGLLALGYLPERIALGGDSAGGGLMFATLAQILASGLPAPGAAFAFSPWVDLTGTSPSLVRNRHADPLLPASRMEETRGYYLAGADPANPRASPVRADFTEGPPVLILAGSTEILLDEALAMSHRLQAAGVSVEVEVWPEAPHVWPIFQGWIPEADAALDRVATFLRMALRPEP